MAKYEARLGLHIAGEWLGANGRDTMPVINPVSGETLADLPKATPADLDRALDASASAFDSWRRTAPQERANILLRTAALLRARKDALAQIATIEQGKVLAEAKGEADAGAMLAEFHAGEAVRIYGRVLPRPTGTRSLVLKQPIGPVAAFCAWNFPILNVVRKLAPAVAAGCSIILKPSEETAGSAVEVMRCFEEAGLPSGVIQIVFGEPDMISRHLLASPVTRKLSFTGSTIVGKHLARLASDTLMRTTMELGGHAPVLVFDDCDLDHTLDTLVAHKFRNAGQVCIAPTRFYVQEGVYQRFADGFAERTRQIKVGNGLDGSTQMGPMANARRPEAIGTMIEDAVGRGARLLAGGSVGRAGGYFFEPTVIADTPLDAAAMNDEPFGPLALLSPFKDLDDGIRLANRLPYGLAAYCFTENGRRQAILGDEIESGMIGINNVRLTWGDSPFGGIKDSGDGSEDGPEGISSHLITKTVHAA